MRQVSNSQRLCAELQTAFHDDMVPKFLATQDTAGIPTVVPIISLDAANERTLIFAELFIWKTRNNLAVDPRVSVAILTKNLHAWTIRGRFRQFVAGGPHLEHFNRQEMFRYNAYVGVSRVGVIDVEAVTAEHAFSKLGVAAGLLAARIVARLTRTEKASTLPCRVADKFARSRAVKVLAFQAGNGYPEAMPVLSLVPARSADLFFRIPTQLNQLTDLKEGTPVAASVITTDPIAYQVKGLYLGARPTAMGRIGRIRCEEVYSASPPLPGERIPPAGSVESPDRSPRRNQ